MTNTTSKGDKVARYYESNDFGMMFVKGPVMLIASIYCLGWIYGIIAYQSLFFVYYKFLQ